MRVSEVSHALFDSCGGSLTYASLDLADGSTVRLAALLRRQKKLKIKFADGPNILVELSQAIAQGCCQGVESMQLQVMSGSFDLESTEFLIRALQVDGALPAVNTLTVTIFL